LLALVELIRKSQQDANLLIQLDVSHMQIAFVDLSHVSQVFWDMKARDEDMLERSHSFDFNEPKDIFNALLDEVFLFSSQCITVSFSFVSYLGCPSPRLLVGFAAHLPRSLSSPRHSQHRSVRPLLFFRKSYVPHTFSTDPSCGEPTVECRIT
jgi:hypothetical protein